MANPIRGLTCCCCGTWTSGRQWWGRDTGYGLCPKCADEIQQKVSPEYMRECYGDRGVHYCVNE